MADGAVNQALIYRVAINAKHHFIRVSSLEVNGNWFQNKNISGSFESRMGFGIWLRLSFVVGCLLL
jgi:hypothetical protein